MSAHRNHPGSASAGSDGDRLAIPSPFDIHIGTQWLDLGPDEARARIAVEDHHKQPFGVVHGGVFATLAESVCSPATYRAVVDRGMTAVGQSNDTSLLRPVSQGHLNAVARPRHRGRTTWVWEVEITDDDGRVCALARVTMAVRPAGRDGEPRLQREEADEAGSVPPGI
ncbi:MAG: PaaI family thioesterase [Actinomycetota bacterium]|nr:PaaI family thioesterase [Actinomycetota bacterium]